ncbi:hypothetical protein HI914_00233 [Erysiphe necator]|nr:hypothetical protein HI914_00233 [Erysiphe necator]
MNFLLQVIVVFILCATNLNVAVTTFQKSIPIQNSIVVPGQDKETIFQDPNSPSLVAVQCRKRRTAQAVIKVAKSACRKLKEIDIWVPGPVGWFRTFPTIYPVHNPEDGFEIAGNPYYVYPMFKPLLAAPGSHTDYVVINKHCQLVGAVTWSKIKANGKNKSWKNMFYKSKKSFTKCMVEMAQP